MKISGEAPKGVLILVVLLVFAWVFAVWGTTVYLVVEKGWSAWWFLLALLLTAGA